MIELPSIIGKTVPQRTKNITHTKTLRITDFVTHMPSDPVFPLLSTDHIHCTKIFKCAHGAYYSIVCNVKKNWKQLKHKGRF